MSHKRGRSPIRTNVAGTLSVSRIYRAHQSDVIRYDLTFTIVATSANVPGLLALS